MSKRGIYLSLYGLLYHSDAIRVTGCGKPHFAANWPNWASLSLSIWAAEGVVLTCAAVVPVSVQRSLLLCVFPVAGHLLRHFYGRVLLGWALWSLLSPFQRQQMFVDKSVLSKWGVPIVFCRQVFCWQKLVDKSFLSAKVCCKGFVGKSLSTNDLSLKKFCRQKFGWER